MVGYCIMLVLIGLVHDAAAAVVRQLLLYVDHCWGRTNEAATATEPTNTRALVLSTPMLTDTCNHNQRLTPSKQTVSAVATSISMVWRW